jgi:hypothetical protein
MAGQAVPTLPPPAPGQATDMASLQAQLATLRIQLTGLQAQWDGLQSQLNAMLKNNPARPGVQQAWADVGVQKARVAGDIARIEAAIAQQQGRPFGTTAIPGGFSRGFNPNMAIPAVTALMVVLAIPVSFAWARRILRGAPKPAPVPHDVTMRLERIEQAVDTIAIEVERISEGQRFVTKVLVQRPGQASDPSSSDVPQSQAKPPLALGAGPMEPIASPERESVRQRVITPH